MDTHSTLNDKIRKTHIRIMLYVLIFMMLRTKTKACAIVKYKKFVSLTFMVPIFIFFVATDLMHIRMS
jgi:hypothetical protein